MTPAEQGRALLEEWKAEHREGGISTCSWCGDEWPCPTSRLIAAVEKALWAPEWDEDAILAKLTEGR